MINKYSALEFVFLFNYLLKSNSHFQFYSPINRFYLNKFSNHKREQNIPNIFYFCVCCFQWNYLNLNVVIFYSFPMDMKTSFFLKFSTYNMLVYNRSLNLTKIFYSKMWKCTCLIFLSSVCIIIKFIPNASYYDSSKTYHF